MDGLKPVPRIERKASLSLLDHRGVLSLLYPGSATVYSNIYVPVPKKNEMDKNDRTQTLFFTGSPKGRQGFPAQYRYCLEKSKPGTLLQFSSCVLGGEAERQAGKGETLPPLRKIQHKGIKIMFVRFISTKSFAARAHVFSPNMDVCDQEKWSDLQMLCFVFIKMLIFTF